MDGGQGEMMDESNIEDALARVLADAYEIACRSTLRENRRTRAAVVRDEKILRQALFGEQRKKTDRR